MYKQMQSNITKYYISEMLQSLWFILSINILYWQSFGITYGQIGIMEMLGAITIVLLEIPTGAIADLIGRKKSVFIGVILSATACFIIGFGSVYLLFILAYIVWAIGDTFISGAKSALIYDTLKQMKKENEYLKIQGRCRLYTTISLIFATAISPFLFIINKRLPYILLGIVWFISAIIIWTMKEPKKSEKYDIKKHIAKMKQGFRYTVEHSNIRWYILFMILIGMPMNIYNDLISQSYYIKVGYSIMQLSILIPLTYGLASIVGSMSYKIEAIFGENKSLILIALIHAISFMFMGILKLPYVIVFVILLYMSRDFRYVVIDNYINKQIVSDIRATVISISNMLFNLIIIIAYPLAGMLMDMFGIFNVLFGFGVSILFSSVILFIKKPNK